MNNKLKLNCNQKDKYKKDVSDSDKKIDFLMLFIQIVKEA